MDFSLSTIGCSLPACLTKRKWALHNTASPLTPSKAQHSPSTTTTNNNNTNNNNPKSYGRQDSDDSTLTASNASSWSSPSAEQENNKIVLNHRDSFLVYLEQAASVLNLKNVNVNVNVNGKQLEDNPDDNDDDTATTMSFSSSSSSCEAEDSSNSPTMRVSFAESLVTEVHYRPYTSKRDKYFLHYNEHDYVDFKMEYVTGKGRNRKVSFQCQDATVHELPAAPTNTTKQDLFYSERDLQGFLDEFVQSLDQRL